LISDAGIAAGWRVDSTSASRWLHGGFVAEVARAMKYAVAYLPPRAALESGIAVIALKSG
jgi:hypothetical protein